MKTSTRNVGRGVRASQQNELRITNNQLQISSDQTHIKTAPTAFLLLFLLASPCWAGNTGHGTNSADFLRITPDSKIAALGNTGVANPDSDFSIFHNPSLLSQSPSRLRLGGAQTEWLLGVKASHYAVSFSWDTQEQKTWGLGFFISDWRTGAFKATDQYGNFSGQVEYQAQDIGLAISHNVTRPWHFGLCLKKISQFFNESGGASAAKTGASVLALDVGTSYVLASKNLVFGAVIQNMGKKTSFIEQSDELPLTLRAGVRGKISDDRFSWNVEAVHDQENALSVKSGLSYEPFTRISLRAGYDTLFSQSNYVGFTTGLGFQLKNFNIDYSFVPFGTLGTTQRISMSWRLGSKTNDKTYHTPKTSPWDKMYNEWR